MLGNQDVWLKHLASSSVKGPVLSIKKRGWGQREMGNNRGRQLLSLVSACACMDICSCTYKCTSHMHIFHINMVCKDWPLAFTCMYTQLCTRTCTHTQSVYSVADEPTSSCYSKAGGSWAMKPQPLNAIFHPRMEMHKGQRSGSPSYRVGQWGSPGVTACGLLCSWSRKAGYCTHSTHSQLHPPLP